MRARGVILLGAPLLALTAGAGRADPLATDPVITRALVTVEGEAALRDRLRPLVAGVAATPLPAPMQDPRFIPQRYGQAIRVERGPGVVVLLTSVVLVDGASTIEVSAGAARGSASVRSIDSGSGLAELVASAGSAGLAALPVVSPGAAGACDEGRIAFFLAFAGDRVVLGNTRMGPSAGGALESLRVVAGRLPEGTPLLDIDGRGLAVAIRPLDNDLTLVAPLCPAPPPAAEPVPRTPASAAGRGWP